MNYLARSFIRTGTSIVILFTLLTSDLTGNDKIDKTYPPDEEDLLFHDIPSVYSASKYDQKVTEAPASVSIVTADEIERYGYRTLTDVLRSLRGFFVTNDRNYDYLGVRGFNRPGDYGTRVLLLLDGMRLNDNIYDSAPTDTSFPVDIDLIERIEVVRGPGSSLYGTNAFFGVINVITKNARDYQGPEALIGGGTFDTYKGRFSYGNRFNNGIELMVSGTHVESEGDDRLFYPEFDINNGVAENADTERYRNLFLKLAYHDLTVQTAYVKRKKFIPTAPFFSVFNDNRTFTLDEYLNIGLKYEHLFDDGLNMTGRLYFQDYRYDGDYIYDYDLPHLVVNKDSSDGAWCGAELQASKSISHRHRIIVGGEFRDNIQQNQRNFDDDPRVGYVDERHDSQVWAVYFQEEFTIFDDLKFNLGVRHDDTQTFGDSTNPRLALIYNPVDTTALKLLYSEAFRAPNAYELFYNDGGLTQLPALRLDPEEIRSVEFIFEQRFGRHFHGSTSIYHNRIDDLISLQSVPGNGPGPEDDPAIFRNINEIEARGVELELEGKWSNGWNGRLSYAYQESKDVNTNDFLTNSPRHLAKANLIAPVLPERLFFGIEVQYMGKRKTLQRRTADAFTVTNLTLFSSGVFHGLKLSAGVFNLFDKKYRDPGSEEHLQDTIAQDGRSFFVELSRQF